MTCCFYGPEKLPAEKLEFILLRLNAEIDKLIERGITRFLSEGAPGFALIGASLVVAKRETGRPVRLIFVLNRPKPAESPSQERSLLFYRLLREADEIHYIENGENDNSLRARGRYLFEHADYCIRCGDRDTENLFSLNEAAEQSRPEIIRIPDEP